MTIFYTEILTPKKEIKAAVFSKHGVFLKNNNKFHLEIRKAINALKNENFYQYESGEFIIYIKLEHNFIVVVTDQTTSSNTISVFISHLTNNEEEIKKLMEKFNSQNVEKKIQDEIRKTKDICAQSLNKILNRGERLKQLDELANQLDFQVKKLQRESKKLGNDGMIAKYFAFGAIFVFIFLVLYFIFK
ncbi:25.3 kDa vesicle transport protein [Dictyocoela muelleri]|nr:25.3 kDa vesicle transport protein [Dictyocoela muelleri]